MIFKKIDIFFKGVYLYSTNKSKTCKKAKERFINAVKLNDPKMPLKENTGFTIKDLLENPDELKTYFNKE